MSDTSGSYDNDKGSVQTAYGHRGNGKAGGRHRLVGLRASECR